MTTHHERRKLCMIAVEFERDRSFERDDEFFDHNPPKDELSRIDVGHSKKQRKQQRERALQIIESDFANLDQAGSGSLGSPASTIDSYFTAPTQFNPNFDSFPPIHYGPQDVRNFLPCNSLEGGEQVRSDLFPIQNTAPAEISDMAYWHQFQQGRNFAPCSTPTPFEAIMREVFRVQTARDMAAMADMAKEQAEYWWGRALWY